MPSLIDCVYLHLFESSSTFLRLLIIPYDVVRFLTLAKCFGSSVSASVGKSVDYIF